MWGWAASAQTDESATVARILVPGDVIERSLSAGGEDRFEVDLAAGSAATGSAWRITVEQLGIDVVIELMDPLGVLVLKVAGPPDREGLESLLLTPSVAGHCSVEVRSELQGVPTGRYRIRLDELATATAADQLRLDGERAFTVAGALFASNVEGDRQRGVESLRQALAGWESLDDQRALARTWFVLGRFYDELDDRQQAVASYGEALAKWRALDDGRGLAATLSRLGLAHKFLGENPQALSYLQEAASWRHRLGQPEREAETRNHLCLIMQKLGRWPAARSCYQATLKLAQQLEDIELQARLLNNLGGIASNLGEPQATQEYFEQALELRRTIGDELGEAATLNNLGAFLRGVGEAEEALLSYGRALAIFERLDNRYWQARTLNNIGFAHLSLGEWTRARSYFLRALTLRRQLADKSGEATTLRNLGRVALRLDEPGRAEAYFRKALERSLQTGSQRGVATARSLLGEALLARDELAAAGSELESALGDLRAMGNRREQAIVLEMLARVQLALLEKDEAKKDRAKADESRALVAEAVDLHRATHHAAGELAALVTQVRIEQWLGRSHEVGELLDQALEITSSLHGRLGDAQQKAAFLASQRQVYELHIEHLMSRHRQDPGAGHDRAALEASEWARSRSLLSVLETAGDGPVADVDPRLRQRLLTAERRFAAQSYRQIRSSGRRQSPQQGLAAEQDLYSALTELEAARAEIRRGSRRYAAWQQPASVDLATMRQLLGEDTVLLEFFVAEERSYLWYLSADVLASFELPPRQQIEDLARQVYQQLSTAGDWSAAARQAVTALGEMLLAPIADRLRGQRLAIVADGALHFIPFAALPDPSTPRQPLLVNHDVVVLPSASVLAAQRRLSTEVSPAEPLVAILADPMFTDLPRLEYSRKEAAAIAELLPKDQVLLALDDEARRSGVIDGALSSHSILHFATHGLIDSSTPELSGLMLSQVDSRGDEVNGFLGLDDVSKLSLSADLVVLSGCRTALGKNIRGEGLVGLTRGFMYAGVPRVVASLWQVRDQATAQLMASFYDAMLRRNLPPAEALRAAQLALRQERRWRDPFFWAAFTLQGDWR